MSTPALFLDRDGTLVHARHYPTAPDELVLYDDIGPRLRRLNAAGFRIVVITNQSGVARGYLTEDDLDAMHRYLARQLEKLDVEISGFYYCPHHPEGVVAGFATACECRKPRPGMLLQAARDLDLDFSQSWVVGDILDDVEAGRRAGCRTVLVDLGTEAPADSPIRRPHVVARDTAHALDIVAASAGVGEPADLGYLPPGWQRTESAA